MGPELFPHRFAGMTPAEVTQAIMSPVGRPSVERVKVLTNLLQRAQRAHDAGDERKARKLLARVARG